MGRVPLASALQSGHLGVAKVLLHENAKLDVVEYVSLYSSSLTWAGHLTIITGIQGDLAPLHVAAQYGHSAIVRLLIEECVDINAREEESGSTAIFLAARRGYSNVVKILLEHGADPSIPNTVRPQILIFLYKA